MKKTPTATFRNAILIAFCLLVSSTAFGQSDWEKAFNANGYYHTTPGSVFTWNGGTFNGYCNGYGTIQWYENGNPGGYFTGTVINGKNEGYGTSYYQNGYKSYEGNWVNDMRNGSGTSYHDDGTVKFKGTFENDKIENYDLLDAAASELTSLIVDKVFDGGTNVRYRLVKAVYSPSGSLQEIRIKMMFNGNIITDNYYQGTLVMNFEQPSVKIVNCNDNLSFLITITVIDKIAEIMDKEFNKK